MKLKDSGIRVFVYGTLKRGHYNHYLLEDLDIKDTDFLGRCYIVGPYRMLNMRWFPGVQRLPDTKLSNRIYGEVYTIGNSTLDALDILEGNGNFFTRTKIATPWKNSWVYFIPAAEELTKKYDLIENGVWKPSEKELAFIESKKECEQAAA